MFKIIRANFEDGRRMLVVVPSKNGEYAGEGYTTDIVGSFEDYDKAVAYMDSHYNELVG